jgi:hypothetical protein
MHYLVLALRDLASEFISEWLGDCAKAVRGVCPEGGPSRVHAALHLCPVPQSP